MLTGLHANRLTTGLEVIQQGTQANRLTDPQVG